MNELRLKYPVRMMRRIMNVSASGYYAWVDRPLSKRAQEEVRLELEIMAAHQRNRQTYGPERLQRDLAEHGVRVGVCRIKRIRQKLGIRCTPRFLYRARPRFVSSLRSILSLGLSPFGIRPRGHPLDPRGRALSMAFWYTSSGTPLLP